MSMNTVLPFNNDSSKASLASIMGDSNLDLGPAASRIPIRPTQINPAARRTPRPPPPVKKSLTKSMERVLLGFEILIIVLFAFFVNYDSEQADALTISQMRVYKNSLFIQGNIYSILFPCNLLTEKCTCIW